ncbi:MAG: amino acid permease [Isosphaeraceae bacterium]
MPLREDDAAGPDPSPAPGFGTATATFVVVSSMVGAGVLTTSGYTVADIRSHSLALVLWSLGGLAAACGALTLAELAASLPRSGGEYVILRAAYGPLAGFLAGWTSFLLGFAAPIAAAASAAAGYLLEPWPHPAWAEPALASLAIAGCTMGHVAGRKGTAGLQGMFGVLTIGLLMTYAIAGLVAGHAHGANLADWHQFDRHRWPRAITALVYVSYAYTGWNGAAYIAGEVKQPGRNVPRAILIGSGLVLVLYLALNTAYALAIPSGEIVELAEADGVDAVKPIAALAARRLWGPGVTRALAIVFGLVLVASLSALILSGSRVVWAMARDGLFPGFAARLSAGGGVPVRATLLLSGLSMALLWTGTFRELVVFASVGLALGSMAAIAAIFVLRRAQPDLPRPFRTPLYPVVPAAYLAITGALVIAALLDPQEGPPARWSLVGILAGCPFYGLLGRGLGQKMVSGTVFAHKNGS